MSYVKVSIAGSIVTGTNSSKCGYFEYDTLLVNRDLANGYIGTEGGVLLKTNKDSAFSVPTLGLTTFNNRGFWKPTITGGASERVNWVAKVHILQQPLGDTTGEFTPNVRAIYQNAKNILLQNLDNLIWN